MEDKLPKKWFIKKDKNNYHIINDWLNKGCRKVDAYTDSSDYVYYPNTDYERNKQLFCYGNHCFSYKRKEYSFLEYIEITFEQFEKHVLNKEVDSPINNNYSIY